MRSEPATIRNYGKLLLDLAQTVPDGMVAFFTSYSYMQEIVREWHEVCAPCKEEVTRGVRWGSARARPGYSVLLPPKGFRMQVLGNTRRDCP